MSYHNSCGHSIPKISAEGEIVGQPISTTLDSDVAKYYLENYLQDKKTNPELDGRIDRVYERSPEPIPTREYLKTISDSFSVDFAALFLAQRLWEIETNREVQTLFLKNLAERKAAIENGEVQPTSKTHDFIVLFVPGWAYKKRGHFTGADMAVPRKLMTELGLENHLVEINPIGTVEENAEFLREEIIRYNAFKRPLLVVGPSSAGPVIHLAFSEGTEPKDLQFVKAWLNLGGVLQGSPLVEHIRKWPRSWYVSIVLKLRGWSKESINSMSSEQGRKRFQRLTLPKHILVFNYLGLSLSGELSKYSKDKYPILKVGGPNDGLTLLTDMLAPGSITIVAPKSDHFFNEDPDINDKTVALAQTIIQYLNTVDLKPG